MKFQPGQSGNPGGRTKADKEIVALAREASPRALERMIELVEHEEPRVALAAATGVLERAYGRPTQPIAGDDDFDPIRMAARSLIDRPQRETREEWLARKVATAA